jgi:hypothetical protein
MARTNLPLTALAANSSVTQPAGTTIDQANGMNVVLASTAVPAAGSSQHLILQVTNSAATSKVVTLRAGVNPPAMRSAIGDLSVTIATTATAFIGPLEPGRFVQTDGSVNVDFATGTTGTINALLVPRNF